MSNSIDKTSLAATSFSKSNISLDQMSLWSNEQKIRFCKETVVDGETLYSLWNQSSHPETLFYDFYDEVMVNLYTQKQKNDLLVRFLSECDEPLDGNGKPWEDLDSFLEENRRFKEEAAEDCYEINPEWEEVLELYIFNWLLKNEYFAEEFLLKFANGQVPE